MVKKYISEEVMVRSSAENPNSNLGGTVGLSTRLLSDASGMCPSVAESLTTLSIGSLLISNNLSMSRLLQVILYRRPTRDFHMLLKIYIHK